MKRLTTLAAGVAVLAIVVLAAGCGGSSGTATSGSSAGSNPYGNSYGSSSSGAMTKGAANEARITVARSSLGRILVSGQDRTLYLFEKDKGNASTCYGACVSGWPPVTTNRAPTRGKGVAAAELGTTKRRNGTLQVTYNGHPLYMYAGDSNAGQTNGEGINEFGAEWYVVSPAGTKIDNDQS